MTTDIKTPYDGFTFLEHQVEGVRWMMERERSGKECCGGILGDDMGLGKTWQTIGLLINAPVSKTLIVAPPVLVAQWSNAFKQAGMKHCVLVSSKWTKSNVSDTNIFISSYDSVKTNINMICSNEWNRIVLDEGHYIRNGPTTQRYKALSKIQAERRWILSGTPVQNKLCDFKNLAIWLGCDIDILTVSKIRATASAIILRRSITLLSDKMPPPPNHIIHKLNFVCPDEERKFKVLVNNLEDAIEKQFGAMVILEKYLRIQQFIAHPQIYIEAMQEKFMSHYEGKDWTGGASKLQKFAELISSFEPTLVFCNFKKEMDLLADEAISKGYDVHFVRGGLNEKTRTAEIEATRNSYNPVMLICQITAGNCGLNLQHLTRVIFYTQHWNPSVIDQALTRSYRYGQTKYVSVHHIILGSNELMNIDRRMLDTHTVKREVAIRLMPSLEFAYHPDIYIE